MRRTRQLLFLLILVLGLTVIVATEALAAEELEIFAGQDKTGRVNVPVDFNDAQIIKPNPLDPERTYTFSWDFDSDWDSNLDGIKWNDAQSNEQFTQWTFHKPGKFTVTLTVEDGFSTATSNLAVTISENAAPEIFANDTVTVFKEMEHIFYADAVDDNAQSHLLRWHWEFGDGSSSDDAPPVAHTFVNTRVYEVKIRVTDPENAVAEHTMLVSVIEKPGEDGSLYTVKDGKISQKGKEIREDGYIAYKLTINDNHDVEVMVTVDIINSPPVAVLIFDNEDDFLDYEVGVGGTWNGDLSNEDLDYVHLITWQTEEDSDIYIVIDNGYQTGSGFGALDGMATVDVTIEDTDHDSFVADIPSFLWWLIGGVVLALLALFLGIKFMDMQASKKQQDQAMYATKVQKDQAVTNLRSFLNNPEGVTVNESERAKHMAQAPPPGAAPPGMPPGAVAVPGGPRGPPPGARPGGPPPGARPGGPPPGARPGGPPPGARPGGPPPGARPGGPPPGARPGGPPPQRGPPPESAPEEAPEAPEEPKLEEAPRPETPDFVAPEVVEGSGPVYLSTEQPKRVSGFDDTAEPIDGEEGLETEPEAEPEPEVEAESEEEPEVDAEEEPEAEAEEEPEAEEEAEDKEKE
jgi:PKD repeat protein